MIENMKDRPLGLGAIRETLMKGSGVSQVVNYSPRKKYDIDRLHEEADKLIS